VSGRRDAGKAVVVTHILHELDRVDPVLDLARVAPDRQEGRDPW